MNRVREQVLDILGRKCAQCGYDKDPRALDVDHVENDGKWERAELQGNEYWENILQNIHTGRYQVLCKTCNYLKMRDHQSLRIKEFEFKKIPTEVGFKRCSKCKKVLLCEMFSRDGSRRDGLDNQCKGCRYGFILSKRGVYMVKLIIYGGERFQGLSSISPVLRDESESAERYGCKVFVMDGENVWRWRQWEKPAMTSSQFSKKYGQHYDDFGVVKGNFEKVEAPKAKGSLEKYISPATPQYVPPIDARGFQDSLPSVEEANRMLQESKRLAKEFETGNI